MDCRAKAKIAQSKLTSLPFGTVQWLAVRWRGTITTT